jgi:CarD family transcriptional regulator
MRILRSTGSATIEQGRGSFRAQAVSQKTRKKSASKFGRKPLQLPAAQPRPYQAFCKGSPRCGHKVQTKKRDARQDCKDRCESDSLKTAASKPAAASLRLCPESRRLAPRLPSSRHQACGLPARRGTEEGRDAAPGLQGQRIRGLSRSRRRPDPGDRGAGDRSAA